MGATTHLNALKMKTRRPLLPPPHCRLPAVVLPPMTPRCCQAGRRRRSVAATAAATLPAAATATATALPASCRCRHRHRHAARCRFRHVAGKLLLLPPPPPHCRIPAVLLPPMTPRWPLPPRCCYHRRRHCHRHCAANKLPLPPLLPPAHLPPWSRAPIPPPT